MLRGGNTALCLYSQCGHPGLCVHNACLQTRFSISMILTRSENGIHLAQHHE